MQNPLQVLVILDKFPLLPSLAKTGDIEGTDLPSHNHRLQRPWHGKAADEQGAARCVDTLGFDYSLFTVRNYN